MKFRKATATLLIAILMVSTFAVAMASDSYEASIIAAADRLVDLQVDGGWEWIVGGTEPPAFNTYGVTALGMIDAYRITGGSSYYDAAEATAEYLLTVDREENSGDRIQSFDYRFLVEFSALSGDPQYEEHAIYQWEWVKTNVEYWYGDGNQETLYNFWYTWVPDSHGYAAWSASDMGLATLAMGDTDYATDMADVIAGHIDDMADDDDCRFIGWGHALELFQAVDPTGYATEIASIVTLLETSQEDDGSWLSGQAEGIAQDTAYAAMGLAAVGRTESVTKATDWLVANQDTSGGWVEGDDEITETDSEALQALCCMAKANFVPGKGLYKPIPNDNFAKGRRKE